MYGNHSGPSSIHIDDDGDDYFIRINYGRRRRSRCGVKEVGNVGGSFNRDVIYWIRERQHSNRYDRERSDQKLCHIIPCTPTIKYSPSES